MKLNAPTKIVFMISVILALLSLVASHGVHIPYVSGHAYWFMTGAFALLAGGNLFKGL